MFVVENLLSSGSSCCSPLAIVSMALLPQYPSRLWAETKPTTSPAIVENLDKFYRGKTVVIVAHRLSTVKNADQIVVIDHGKVVETGNHETLTAKRGAYYNLVKNQLELGN